MPCLIERLQTAAQPSSTLLDHKKKKKKLNHMSTRLAWMNFQDSSNCSAASIYRMLLSTGCLCTMRPEASACHNSKQYELILRKLVLHLLQE